MTRAFHPVLALALLVSLFGCAVATNTTAPHTPAPPPKRYHMTNDAWVTVGVIIALFLSLLLNLFNTTGAVFTASTFLWIYGVIWHDDYFSGVNNNGVMAIVAMMVIAHPIAELPLVRKMVHFTLQGKPGGDVRWPLFKLCLITMLISTWIENIPQCAMFIPLIKTACRATKIAPSQVLMPFVVAILLGNYAIIGSSNNLIVTGLMKTSLGHEMQFFELAKVGGISSIITFPFVVLLAPYLLPKDKGGLFRLVRERGRSFLLQLHVLPGSVLIGQKAAEIASQFERVEEGAGVVELVELRKNGVIHFPLTGNEVIEASDVIVVSGDVEIISSSVKTLGVEYFADSSSPTSAATPTSHEPTSHHHETSEFLNLHTSFARPVDVARVDIEMHQQTPTQPVQPTPQANLSFGRGSFSRTNVRSRVATKGAILFEVVLSSRSPSIDTTILSGTFQFRYSASVLACRRAVDSADLVGMQMDSHLLKPGDTLLILASESFYQEWHRTNEFLLIASLHQIADDDTHKEQFFVVPRWFPYGTPINDSPKSRKQIPVPEWYPYLSFAIFCAVCGGTIGGYVLIECCVYGIVVLVFLGLVNVREAVNSVDWSIYILVAFSFGLGAAMKKSHLADVIAQGITDGNLHGFKLFVVIALISSTMSNLVTNKSTVQVMFPIIISIYKRSGGDPLPCIAVLTITCAYAFCTPYGYATNAMIMGPGGYKPVDFVRYGLLINIIAAISAAFGASLCYGVW